MPEFPAILRGPRSLLFFPFVMGGEGGVAAFEPALTRHRWSWYDRLMTNEPNPPIDMTATRARILARLVEDAARYANPTLPATVNRPAPRARRTSVRHRAIR